jgi:hypothetical protein
MAHTCLVALDKDFKVTEAIRNYGTNPQRIQFLANDDIVETFDASQSGTLKSNSTEWIGSGGASPTPDETWDWYIKSNPSGMIVSTRHSKTFDYAIYAGDPICYSNNRDDKFSWKYYFDDGGYYVNPKDRYIRILTFTEPRTITKSSPTFVNPWGSNVLTTMNFTQILQTWNFRIEGDEIWFGSGQTSYPDETWDWYVLFKTSMIYVHFTDYSTEIVRLFDSNGVAPDFRGTESNVIWDSETRVLKFKKSRVIGSISSGAKNWYKAKAGCPKKYSMLDFTKINRTNRWYFVKSGICLTEAGWAWANSLPQDQWEEIRDNWYQNRDEIRDDLGVRHDYDLGQSYVDSILEEIVVEKGSAARTIRDFQGSVVTEWYDIVDTYINTHFDRLYVESPNDNDYSIVNYDPSQPEFTEIPDPLDPLNTIQVPREEYLYDRALYELNTEYLRDDTKTISRITKDRDIVIKPEPGQFKDKLWSWINRWQNQAIIDPEHSNPAYNFYQNRLDSVIPNNDPRIPHDLMTVPVPSNLTDQQPDWINAFTKDFPIYELDENKRLVEIDKLEYDNFLIEVRNQVTEQVYEETGFDPDESVEDDPDTLDNNEKEDWEEWKREIEEEILSRYNQKKDEYDNLYRKSRLLNRIQNYIDYRQQWLQLASSSAISWPPEGAPGEPSITDFINKFDEKYYNTVKYWIGFYLKFMRVDEGFVTYPNSYVLSRKYANNPLIGRGELPTDAAGLAEIGEKLDWFDVGPVDSNGFSVNDLEGYFSFCQDKIDSLFESISAKNKKYAGESTETETATEDRSIQELSASYIDVSLKYTSYEQDKDTVSPAYSTDGYFKATFMGKNVETGVPGVVSMRGVISPSRPSMAWGKIVSQTQEDGSTLTIVKEYPIPSSDPDWPFTMDENENKIENTEKNTNRYEVSFTIGGSRYNNKLPVIQVYEFNTSVFYSNGIVSNESPLRDPSYSESHYNLVPSSVSFVRDTDNSNDEMVIYKATVEAIKGKSYMIKIDVEWNGTGVNAGASGNMSEDWECDSAIIQGFSTEYVRTFMELDKLDWFKPAIVGSEARKHDFEKVTLPNMFCPFDEVQYNTKEVFFNPSTEKIENHTFRTSDPFFQPGYGTTDVKGYTVHRYHWPYWFNRDENFANGTRQSLYNIVGTTSNRVQEPDGDSKTVPNHPRNKWDTTLINPEDIIKKFTYQIANPFYGNSDTEVIGRIMTLKTYDFIFVSSDAEFRYHLTHDYPDNCSIGDPWSIDVFYSGITGMTDHKGWQWHFEKREDDEDADGNFTGRNDYVGQRPLSYTYVLHSPTEASGFIYDLGQAKWVEIDANGNPFGSVSLLQIDSKSILWHEYKARYAKYRSSFEYFTDQLAQDTPATIRMVLSAGEIKDNMYRDLRGKKTIDEDKTEWTDTKDTDINVTDRWERLEQTLVEKILNKGQHAVLTLYAPKLNASVLAGIIGWERIFQLNDWIPY